MRLGQDRRRTPIFCRMQRSNLPACLPCFLHCADLRRSLPCRSYPRLPAHDAMKTLKGTVTSAKMQNTVTVEVTRYVTHPLYQKRFPVSKKFLADTNNQTVKEWDAVLIGECRPLSKRKHFKVLEILQSGLVKEGSLEEELKLASGKDKSSVSPS